jgi:hypothetical protein
MQIVRQAMQSLRETRCMTETITRSVLLAFGQIDRFSSNHPVSGRCAHDCDVFVSGVLRCFSFLFFEGSAEPAFAKPVSADAHGERTGRVAEHRAALGAR